MPGTATDIALVSLSGELDLYEVGPLKDALAAADKLDPHAVVVDLSGVSFLDSTACGIFVDEANRLRRADAKLVLVSNGNRASRVLHRESNPGNARHLVQKHGDRELWVTPPPIPLISTVVLLC